MRGYSLLHIQTVRELSEAMAVTSTGHKRKENDVAIAATKTKLNIRSSFIWSSNPPETFPIVLNFDRDYCINTTWITKYLLITTDKTNYVMYICGYMFQPLHGHIQAA
jgi:hypothetical protein